MRIAYLDCFSGMSGDMFLGAPMAKRSCRASSIGNSMPTRMSARTGMTMIILITKSRLRCGSTISL